MDELIVANPLVSRGKPSFAAGAWRALQVGPGPRRVLVRWAASSAALPRAYRIESSASSTDGSDGAFRTDVAVSDNELGARAHSFEFDGQSWVRFRVADDSAGGIPDALDVHDASDGTDDTWLFFGDELIASAFGRDTACERGSFAEVIHERYPGYFPAVFEAGVAGEPASAAAVRIEGALGAHPEVRFIALGLGLHDARRRTAPEDYRDALERIVARILDAGRVPVLARLPPAMGVERTALRELNGVIDEVSRRHGLLPGPDLGAGFADVIRERFELEGLTRAARAAIHRLWADAVDPLYVPQ